MQVVIYEARNVEIRRNAKSRIAKARANQLCFACGQKLDGKRIVRHCHERCYRAIMRAIESGSTTEAEEVANGYLDEAGTGGRPPSNPVTQRLRA